MARVDLVTLDAESLNRRRIVRGMTKAELSVVAKINGVTVRKALCGQGVSIRSARALADALGMKYASILRQSMRGTETKARQSSEQGVPAVMAVAG